ncbi:hypothetical protein HPJ99_06860 [Anoxybacillus flavithermus]|uniref:hypothetical protein n=1 Tax=Anoxybacillus flavithermus TaxID=33934 RepID=UPI0018675472|nr:hypothetical protein [Anoxybacillus flavithermus]MBE2934953.1 hypothetical protein [Anoxybacillus flavithermus]MBE2945892.1 hypothetical protein [Anoxybacillus flavithermus]MBE2948730.1 hypothetical protein [Anoxybacillus flavithermus]
MRTIQIGEKQIGLKATPLALLYYKQAFNNSDLIGDMMKMQSLADDPSTFDSVLLLQIAWAMAKAHEGVGKPFPDFTTWVAELDSFDFSDTTVMGAIMDEATDGFFRRSGRNGGNTK